MKDRVRVLVVLVAALSLSRGARGETPVAEALRDLLESDDWPSLHAGGERLHAAETIAEFYDGRRFAPVWSTDPPRIDRLLEVLAAAEGHGLRRADYHHAWLAARAAAAGRGELAPEAAAELEVVAADAFVLYALHLGRGKVREERIAGWHVDRPDVELGSRLARAADADPERALDGLLPLHPGYGRLREELRRLRGLAAAGGWPAVSPGPSLRAGEEGSRVLELRRRLLASRDLEAAEAGGFDDQLAAAVRRFQARHGLEQDGVVGPKTLAELNVPVARRIEQVEVNLERWRWLEPDLGARYVLVNIAGFSAGLYDRDRLTLGMRAVVGKTYHRTPIFSDLIRYVVLSPYWNIPRSIAAREIRPKGRRYMARRGIEVLPGGRLRQRPGPNNALGRVKFIFPNRFNVYLHDTPARELFARASRPFSHGCIRVAEPIQLATLLLAEQGWTREQVVAAAERGRERSVHLERPVPVHILYWTAWVDDDQTLQFRGDVYGRDGAVARALRVAPPQ